MKTLANIYVATCVVVLGFFVVLHLPWALLPFSDGINLAIVGGALLSFAIYYTYYFYRREGFELGWFLSHRFGFWIIGIGILGAITIVVGLLAYLSPDVFVRALEQGALPFGIALVSLFWLSLIYLFGYLSVGMIGRVVASLRILSFRDALVSGVVALFCLGLAGLFFSLFLEVLNDIAMKIGIDNQWTAIWIFVGGIVAAGFTYGVSRDPLYHLEPNADRDNQDLR